MKYEAYLRFHARVLAGDTTLIEDVKTAVADMVPVLALALVHARREAPIYATRQQFDDALAAMPLVP